MENISSKVVTKVTHPVKVLQFGEGNFLRAFVNWIIDTMNKKANFNAGVVVVQPMPFGRVKELSEAEKMNYNSTPYTYGYVINMPFENTINKEVVVSMLFLIINSLATCSLELACVSSKPTI